MQLEQTATTSFRFSDTGGDGRIVVLLNSSGMTPRSCEKGCARFFVALSFLG